jgi:hypothetical protein
VPEIMSGRRKGRRRLFMGSGGNGPVSRGRDCSQPDGDPERVDLHRTGLHRVDTFF